MKQTIRLNERDLRNLISEAVKEIRRKKEPKRGTIEWKDGKRIDAVEDGVDKYGNPMYRVKDGSVGGRKCKDGSCRVQSFDFLPYGATDKEFPFNENKLKNLIRESVAEVSNKSTLNKLEDAKDILYGITTSNFIPFASPVPSSTEEMVKNAILEAIQKIEDAMTLTKRLYGNRLYVHNN